VGQYGRVQACNSPRGAVKSGAAPFTASVKSSRSLLSSCALRTGITAGPGEEAPKKMADATRMK